VENLLLKVQMIVTYLFNAKRGFRPLSVRFRAIFTCSLRT
jgi:hypothetical protein